MSTETTQTTTEPTQTPPNNTPDPRQAELDRVLTENQNLRKSLKETEGKFTSLETQLKDLQKAGHKTSGDWQKVAETAENEAKTWREKHSTANQAFVNTLVSAKVREEALKNGFKKDLVDLLDSMEFDEIEASIEDNKFNVKGAENAISNLKKLRPSLFETPPPPTVNNGIPGNGSPGAPKTVENAKAAFQAAFKLRYKDPTAFNKAQLDYQNAIFEAKRAKK
jgi:hypothetical protein